MKASEYQIRQGGLYRCCLITLEETDLDNSPADGDIIACSYCGTIMGMSKGSWEWDPRNSVEVPATP